MKKISTYFFIIALLFLISSADKKKTSATANRKPNIIIILADDLGYGDLSGYGQQQWATPNIDRLGTEGAKLVQFYTPTPYCAPTRASLLTGRYPVRNKLTINPNPEKTKNFQTYRGNDDVGIADSELLLSEILKQQGYATKIIGKWHLGHKPEFYPTRHGFDEYFGIPYSNDMRPVVLMENEQKIEYPVVQTTLTKRYTKAALDFIDKNKDQPFFLYLPQAMPHKPMAVSEEFYTPNTKEDLYADAMRELDWSVGEVMKKIQEHKLDENTIIVFLSDNGPWFGGSSGGLRGMKAQNWEGGIRVPFLIKWQGHIPAGHTSPQPAGVIDVFPTLLKAASINVPKELVLDGKDIFPLLTSNVDSPHDALFSFYVDKLQTVRSGKWKLHILSPEPTEIPDTNWIDPRWPDGVTILAPYEQAKPSAFPGISTGDKAAPMLLFDLEKDPSEQHNVASQHPEIVKKLKAKAAEFAAEF